MPKRALQLTMKNAKEVSLVDRFTSIQNMSVLQGALIAPVISDELQIKDVKNANKSDS